MRIIIVGCGKVGTSLAELLCKDGHNLTLIDLDERHLNKLTSELDVTAIVGTGTSYRILKEAGVKTADLLIAVTTHDEINLLSCIIAGKAGHCHTIARVRDPEYVKEVGFIHDKLEVNMAIHPELSTARKISRLIRLPSGVHVSTFSKGRVELLELQIPEHSHVVNKKVSVASAMLGCHALFCMVRRDKETYIPKGDFVLQHGDTVTVIVPIGEQDVFFEKIGIRNDRNTNAMLIGGGKISLFLAQILCEAGISVKIIEWNLDRCEALADALPAATIIHGDGTDRDLLEEEGLQTCDAFVALTGIDEENILLSLYAAKHSHAKRFTKINRVNFEEVIADLPLGTVIRPKQTTADVIIKYIRSLQNSQGSNIETLYQLGAVEALEFRVMPHHPVGRPLQDLPFRPEVLLCSINHKGRPIIPQGRDILYPGDTVIVVSTKSGFTDLNDIFLPMPAKEHPS